MGSEVVMFGDSGGYLRKVPLNTATPSFGAAAQSTKFAASLSGRASLIGKGGVNYVIGSDGVVRAYDNGLVELWNGSAAPVLNAAMSELNLDINRDVAAPCSAGQPGVLYVTASSSNETRVYAILVDSAGLDRGAPWPKHQHDPSNTGNPATLLNSWTCP
jgi:hypothetical protein